MNFLASNSVPWWIIKWACASAARCLSVRPTGFFFLRVFVRLALGFCFAFCPRRRFHAACVCRFVASDCGGRVVLLSIWVSFGDGKAGDVASTAVCCATDGGLVGHKELFAPATPIVSASFLHSVLFAATYCICDRV